MKYLFRLILSVFMLFLLIVPAMAEDPVLYGVVQLNNGHLVTIDISTGEATEVGRTSLGAPSGLTYDLNTGILYAVDRLDREVAIVNISDGSTTDLREDVDLLGMENLAHRYVDNLLYSAPDGPTPDLHQIDPSDGSDLATIRTHGDGNIRGLTVRPSDGQIFGAGTASGYTSLFKVRIEETVPVSATRTHIGDPGRVITALAFHPNGTLYATDGDDLFTLDPETGLVIDEIGSFGDSIGTIAGLAFVTPYTPGRVDVWIKDCYEDTGSVPSTDLCPRYWESTDIWIDNDNDMEVDAPVYGIPNTLKAIVRNNGAGTAVDVSVKFYIRDNTTGLVFPDGADEIGEDTVTVPPGGIVLASVEGLIPDPPRTGGHYCIGVVLDHPDDRAIVPAVLSPHDNNVGIANVPFIAGRSGEDVILDFNVGSVSKSGYGLTPWPRNFIVKVISKLPEGWSWALDGITPDEPFSLRLGDIKPVTLKVTVADGAPAHSGGSIEVQQVDVLTGKIVGGIEYNLYEDHRPPEPVKDLKVSVIDNQVELTWKSVFKEAETKLKERVAYYEILKNGEPVAKVLRDGNRFKPDMQWLDEKTGCGELSYTVRVVDEGNNISQESPEAATSVPCEDAPNNWLTILLVMIILVLLVMIACYLRRTRS